MQKQDEIEVIAVPYEDMEKESLIRMLNDRDAWIEDLEKQRSNAVEGENKALRKLTTLENAANDAIEKLDNFHKGRFNAMLTILDSAKTLAASFSYDKED